MRICFHHFRGVPYTASSEWIGSNFLCLRKDSYASHRLPPRRVDKYTAGEISSRCLSDPNASVVEGSCCQLGACRSYCGYRIYRLKPPSSGIWRGAICFWLKFFCHLLWSRSFEQLHIANISNFRNQVI